jgi:hypothetical protein
MRSVFTGRGERGQDFLKAVIGCSLAFILEDLSGISHIMADWMVDNLLSLHLNRKGKGKRLRRGRQTIWLEI